MELYELKKEYKILENKIIDLIFVVILWHTGSDTYFYGTF